MTPEKKKSTNPITNPSMIMEAYRAKRDEQRITIQEKYYILGFISSGTYGKVYKAQTISSHYGHISSGSSASNSSNPHSSPHADHQTDLVAIKKFKPDREGELSYTGISQSACREIMLNREISHENVTALQEVMLQDKSIYLVFEYCEHDFLQIIHYHSQSRTIIPELTLKSLLWQLLNGVHYLHSNWIIHRDLKPANILVTNQGVVKIGDLGLARTYQSPIQSLYSSDKVVVTIWYRSPELLLGAKHYTPSIDIWSIGCIFAELIYLRPIFKGEEAKPDPHLHHHSKKNSSHHHNGVPFQRDQLVKIFEILGFPSKEDWPSIVHLPEYPHLSRFEKTQNTLRQWYNSKTINYKSMTNVMTGGGQQPAAVEAGGGYELMRDLLRYDPTKRIQAAEALTHNWFRLSSNNPVQPHKNCFKDLPPNLVYPVRRVTKDDSDSKLSSLHRGVPHIPLSSDQNNVRRINPGSRSVAYNSLSSVQSGSRPATTTNDNLPFRIPKRARYD